MMQKLRIPLMIAACLAILYCFPRLLLTRWQPDDPWLNYFYQYGFGLLVFLIGLWIVIASGALKRGRGRDGFWFKVMVVGFCVYATVHAVWIWIAISVPLKGVN